MGFVVGGGFSGLGFSPEELTQKASVCRQLINRS